MLRRWLTTVVTLAAPLAAVGCGSGLEQTADAPTEPVRAPSAMVASTNFHASRAGRDVLQAGGNAVDAAIATGLALAAVHPSAGNIGGGGFMVIRFPDGRATTIEFREKAPLTAHAEMWLDSAGEYSYGRHHDSHLAVGVPGTVAGFALAHERYGSGAWADLVEPAVGLAADGFELTPSLARGFEYVADYGAERGYDATVDKFTRDDGSTLEPGDLWRQPELARTLERIRDQGRDGFYTGETARLIAEEMQRGGGMITEEDLARYEANEREPIRGSYRGYDVIGMPPPSSGGVAVVEMLNILEGYDLVAMAHNSAPYLHHVTEAMRRAYRDRARHLADTDFVDVPVERLTSKEYADEVRVTVDPERATSSSPSDIEEEILALAYESPQTTHYSVVDANGLAVSVTYTLEQGYGSKIVVPGGGFLLNNEMGDFNVAPGMTTESGRIGTEPNLARPEQRMLSSMSPTILTRNGELVAVYGSPGGRTIINTVLQITLNLVDHRMNIQEAVNAARVHHQWLPDELNIEGDAVDDDVLAALQALGHTLDVGGRQGVAHAIMIDPVTGERLGAVDPRGSDGEAAGY